MLYDLGETIWGTTLVFRRSHPRLIWQVAALGTVPTTTHSRVVSETPHCLLGIAKDRLTFSELMEGGGRNCTWAWTDLGPSGASVILCVP